MQIKLIKYKTIDYPSGSALEFYKNTFYLIGDDINYVLCLDTDFNEIDKIKLFDFDGARIPKAEKPDFESATIIDDVLYVLGSGSKSPQRENIFSVDLIHHKIEKISAEIFFSTIKNQQIINEINIEGFAKCKNNLLFFNRANLQQPNHLIITSVDVFKNQNNQKIKILPIEIDTLNNFPLGISGACYNEKNDVLFLSASAENTNNTYDDGEIIGSAIGIIYNASQKINNKKLSIENIIELNKINNAFSKQKIESICITKQNENSIYCTLVADNDDGKSVLFDVEINID